MNSRKVQLGLVVAAVVAATAVALPGALVFGQEQNSRP